MAEAMTADQAVGTAGTQRRSLKDWVGWHYLPGLAFLVVGIVALAEPPLASLAASIYVGAMLCVAGAFMAVGGIANLGHRGGWIGLVLGLLSLATGFIILRNPGVGAVSLVRVLGAWLIAGGILEVAIGFNIAVGRGWLVLVSIINIVLGVFVLRMQPGAAFHFLGYFVGASLVIQGLWSLLFTADLQALRRSIGLAAA